MAVDSHIQRIVLASEETTVTQQVSNRTIKCQFRSWSQRVTKVNGSQALDGTAEPVSRDHILRRERGHGNTHFSLFS